VAFGLCVLVNLGGPDDTPRIPYPSPNDPARYGTKFESVRKLSMPQGGFYGSLLSGRLRAAQA
jgi:hypothetical protein